MRRKTLCWIGVLIVLFGLAAHPQRAAAATTLLFANGNQLAPAFIDTARVDAVRASGFNTVILFTMTIDASGNFTYNDGVPVCSNGVYTGGANWATKLAQCKVAPTSVTRIEMCIDGAGDPSFANIKNRILADGTGTNTILYRNLLALRTGLGIDAVCYDDEDTYDSASSIQFGNMSGAVGMKVTLCPYMNPSYWQAVKTGLGSICDQVYLQWYDGGAGNNPATWNTYFGGLKVVAGYWDWERDQTFLNKMLAAADAGCSGGFYWPSCTGCSPPTDANGMKQYADWIRFAFDDLITKPAVGFTGVAAYNSRVFSASTVFTLSNAGPSSLSWSVINTSSWLTVSSPSGTLAAGTATPVTVSLNTPTATNLALGLYTANVLVSNQTSKIVKTRTFTLNTAVINWPVTLVGFNAGILASNNATSGSPGATAFDVPNNYCFYQTGLSGSTRGLPVNGVISSQSDSSTAFQLGNYGATNALMMGAGYPSSGTLTLTTPQAFSSLAILASSANGGGQGTFILNFTNGTSSAAIAYNAQDWFYVLTNVAIQGFGRLKLGAGFNAEDNGGTNPNLYQTVINLAALGLTQPIASITFSKPAAAGSSGVFAVSGMSSSVQMQPPTGLAAIPGTNGTVLLTWKNSAGAINYNIRRSTVSGGPYTFIGNTAATNLTVSGLANGTTYYFVVSAVGAFNESVNTAQVSTMPGSYLGWAFDAKPVAYWPLNETAGPVAYDLARGSNGVYGGTYSLLNSGLVAAGFANPHRVVFFNGTSGYTQVPRMIGSTNFSIVFWMRTSAAGGTPNWYNGQGLVDGEVGGTTGDLGVSLVGNKVGFGIGNPDTTLTSVSVINNNTWRQVAVTRNITSGLMTIFIDGKYDSSTTGPTGARTAPANLRFGGIQAGGGFFSGYLSDVAMYEQVLTTNQIATLFSAATGLFYDVTLTNKINGANLVLSWPGNGKLLEATNLSGPWTTNVSTSPVIIVPNQPQKFYRIKTQ